jgi:protease I
MGGKLDNKRIAILATEGFEYVELKEPLEALEKAGAKPEIVSQKAGKIRGWNYTDWGGKRCGGYYSRSRQPGSL